MLEKTCVVQHEVGLHARPAALFVQAAKRFASEIVVCHGERRANAKSILSVLTLGANQGAVLTLQAEGSDAAEALAALEKLLEGDLGEGN